MNLGIMTSITMHRIWFHKHNEIFFDLAVPCLIHGIETTDGWSTWQRLRQGLRYLAPSATRAAFQSHSNGNPREAAFGQPLGPLDLIGAQRCFAKPPETE